MNFIQLLLISVTFNVTANILLKKAVISFGGISGNKTSLIPELLKAASTPILWIGLCLYGLSFLIWLRVLTFNDLSRSYPIFAAVVFLFTTIGSMLFLKENISATRILGIIIILSGIYIVAVRS